MRFEFSTATRILFGPGSLRQSGPILNSLGKRALLVTGSNPQRSQSLQELLAGHKIRVVPFSFSGEPTIEAVQAGLQAAQAEPCDFVVACGGGSAIDLAKAVAGLLTNGGELLDYLEVVGQGRSLEKPGAPLVAVPTTAGAGAEVTKNAVIASPDHQVKASLRSPHLLARLAIVDPELTYTLPPAITASTGLDALTQLIEPFVSHRANPLTDSLCREGLRRAAPALHRAVEKGHDAAAREDMALASLFGGFALANAGLGAVHGFAAPIGGRFRAPHGAVCAALLPHVMAANIQALRQREPQSPVLRRYEEVACLLTGKAQAGTDDAVQWVRQTCNALHIPRLGAYGLTSAHVASLCEQAARASSMKGNPLLLTPEELTCILESAL